VTASLPNSFRPYLGELHARKIVQPCLPACLLTLAFAGNAFSADVTNESDYIVAINSQDPQITFQQPGFTLTAPVPIAQAFLTLTGVLDGSGNRPVLDGAGLFRILRAPNGADVINNVIFQNADAGTNSGGAMNITNLTGSIQNNHFISNKAQLGGALTLGGTPTGSVINNVFANNVATTEGGALFASFTSAGSVISGNLFTGNSAGQFGGAVRLPTMVGTIENNQFIGNFTNFNSAALSISDMTGDIIDNLFLNNQAGGGSGGALRSTNFQGNLIRNVFKENMAALEGGALQIDAFVGDIVGNTFEDNTAQQSGGAIWMTNPSIDWVGNLYDSVFTNNVAVTRFGGAIDAFGINGSIQNTRFIDNRAVLGGGAIASAEVGAIRQSLFLNNAVAGGAALTVDAGNGGALSLDDNVTLIDSVFLGNIASSTNPLALDSGWGGALLHHDALSVGASVNVSASAGNTALFYGNTQTPFNSGETPNAIHFGNYNATNANLQTTLNVQGAGRVLMLDALSSQQDGLTRQNGTLYGNLTTVVNKTGTGEWYLGGQSQMQGASTWNVSDGVLRLVTTDYGGSIGVLPTQINLTHGVTSQFTLNANATLAGTGTIRARDVALSGTLRPNTWINTGTLAPDLVAASQTIIDAVTAAVMADVTIPDANKLFVINTQVRQQVANLVNVQQDTNTFGTLTFEGLGGNDVTMNNATLDVNLNYNNGSAQGDRIEVRGTSGVLDVIGTNNTINIAGLTFTGTIPPDDAGIQGGNLATFASVIETDNGIVNGNAFNLTIAGQPVAQVDFADAFGGVVGNDYKLGVGLSWYSTRKDGALIDQAHGDFTLAGSSQFTLDGDLGNRTNTDKVNWDGQSLTKRGDGTLILNGVNTYTGPTSVMAGSLVLGDANHATAQIAGSVQVTNSNNAPSTTLRGFGTVRGNLDVQQNATLAPGSNTTIGTLTAGQVVFDPDSTFAVKIDESWNADKINAQVFGTSTGTVDLNGATLRILNGGSNLPVNWLGIEANPYLIVDSANGVTGFFNDVQNNLSTFLDFSLDYLSDPRKVFLRMRFANAPFIDICETTNQCEVGDGIVKLPPGDPIRGVIAGLPDDDARRNAYDNLSGEIYGSTRAALISDRQLRDAVNRRMQTQTAEGTHLWIDTWGHSGQVKGNANAARINTSGLGLALGADHQFTPTLRAGAFFGYEDNRIKNGNNRNARSDVDGFSLGAYAAASVGAVELRAGAALSRLDVDTRRDIVAGTLQGRVKSDGKGHKTQLFAEAARPFKLNDTTTISPYLNVAQVWLRTNAATESGNAAALDIARQTDSVQVSTLGVKAAISLPTQTPIQLTADLGWTHTFGDTDGKTSNRFAGRGSRLAWTRTPP